MKKLKAGFAIKTIGSDGSAEKKLLEIASLLFRRKIAADSFRMIEKRHGSRAGSTDGALAIGCLSGTHLSVIASSTAAFCSNPALTRVIHRIVLSVLMVLAAAVCAQASPTISGLVSSGPAPDLAEELMLFGQFAGDWACDVVLKLPNGSKVSGTCEWHFGWVLDGRAIQDVWIAKYKNLKSNNSANAYGTTLRWYDPGTDVWHVLWVNAQQNVVHSFSAKKIGNEIVLNSQDGPNHLVRWVFNKISPQSFHWRSEVSTNGGKTWFTGQEMSARRTTTSVRNADSDRETIKNLERDWLDHESDRVFLEHILADDFVHPVTTGAFLSKKEHIAWAMNHLSPTNRKRLMEGLSVRLYGDTAVATGTVVNSNPLGGNPLRTIFTDIFVYRDGRWSAVSAQENSLNAAQ